MRPGRLDKLLYVGPPDLAGRKEILAIRTKKMSVDPGLDLDVLAELVSALLYFLRRLALERGRDKVGEGEPKGVQMRGLSKPGGGVESLAWAALYIPMQSAERSNLAGLLYLLH
jgi:SpoVK/Ycf46/Vps4 family AAA+-type ATPase